MTAEQTEVVGQDVTVERLAELSTECTTTDTTGQATEDGTRHGTEGDADRASERADSCASLATCQGSADFHGVMEGSDFGGETARAVQ